jgi:hypothetical protein
MQYLVPADTTFTTLLCRSRPESGNSSATVTLTLRVNGVDQSLTCATSSNSSAATGTGSVTVSAGDLVSIAAGSTSGNARYVWWALS